MWLTRLKRYLIGASFPLSFRQLLLLSFLSIILLLGGALTRTLVVVETLTEANREYPVKALEIVEDVRELQELTVALERSARQYLVLNDPGLRRELKTLWDKTQGITAALGPIFPERLLPLTEAWQTLAAKTLTPFLQATDVRNIDQAGVFAAFQRLGEINQQINRESKSYLTQRNQALIDDFERQRRALIVLGISAATVAGALALALGMWLAWSFEQLDVAIDQLGTQRPDTPIAIGGPSDMRQLGQRIDWLRQRLATLEADKLLFLRHISHELKTPLANLREGIALLEDQVTGDLTGHQKEIIVILRENAIALQHQIEGLLQYNATAFDARRLERRVTDLRALLEDVVNRQRLQFQGRNIEVTVEGDALKASVDPAKMEVAAGNLLSNAIRFSPEGGQVRFTLSRGPGTLRVDCVDTGPGIDPGDQDKIFNPFYQGVRQPAGARKGSGIGLSIVKELIEAHGGTVTLLSGSGGAHFRIEIPDESI